MDGFASLVVVAAVAAEALSLASLVLGGALVGHRVTAGLGRLLHRQKMRSLERLWPMTLLREALDRRDRVRIRRLVTALICVKSAACAPLGLVALPWLPIAALLVPSVVAAHDPGNADLRHWARNVSIWQVTSHLLAAAPGFALTWLGPLQGRSALDLLAANAGLVGLFWVLSAVCAVQAGRMEAAGLVAHWRPGSVAAAPPQAGLR